MTKGQAQGVAAGVNTYVWWRRRESFFSTAFGMFKLLILQGHEVPKMPICRVHRTPIVHGVGEDKAKEAPQT
jgi:hypothetical protein